MRGVAAVGAALVVVILAGCGGDDADLNEDQKQASRVMQSDGGLSSKDADCIAGKLTGEALDSASHDGDFSELNGAPGGSDVASAYEDCTGKNFREVFGYQP